MSVFTKKQLTLCRFFHSHGPMLFNSLTYALFLALFVALYYASFMRRAKAQLFLVLAGSYAFYAAWDWRFLALIVATTLTSYFTAIAIEGHRRRGVLVLNILFNVGLLAFFKYFNFFAENLIALLGYVGWEVDWVLIHILLPVGISFYTFQAIGYTVDVWRGEIRAERNPLLFASFIAYFPQLVAGPIERARDLLPQLDRAHRWDYSNAVSGMRLILWGMFKKVAVADTCGELVNKLYSPELSSSYYGLGAYAAAFFFLIQIYCDFSGYCEIAKGSARLLGVELMDNFRRPYFSRNTLEFWHRWHISLMRWFTAYIYIPLGGSRSGHMRTYRNVMIVFLLSGLWHGASWGFVVWGVLCGLIYCVQKAMRLPTYRKAEPPTLRDVPAMFLTFNLYLVPMVFFRIPGVGEALELCMLHVLPWTVAFTIIVYVLWYIVKRIPNLRPVSFSSKAITPLLALGGVVLLFMWPLGCLHVLFLLLAVITFIAEWHTRGLDTRMFPLPATHCGRMAVYLALYLCVLAYGMFSLYPISSAQQFIYFRF